jgi:hypothetical protein
LRVEIHQRRPTAVHGAAGREVARDRGLAHAAFRIEDDDPLHGENAVFGKTATNLQ